MAGLTATVPKALEIASLLKVRLFHRGALRNMDTYRPKNGVAVKQAAFAVKICATQPHSSYNFAKSGVGWLHSTIWLIPSVSPISIVFERFSMIQKNFFFG